MPTALAPPTEFVLQIKLTNKCNMRCERCYNLPVDEKIPELDTKAWSTIINGFRKLTRRKGMIAHTHFIGGEPLLRPDVYQLAHQAGGVNDANATLVTNGLEINDDIAIRIGKAFHAVTVSLPAVDEEAFKRIRGIDAFHQVTDNVRSLVSRCENVALAANILHKNVGSVGNLIPLAVELGVRRVSFHRFIGTTKLEEWHPTSEMLLKCVKRIRELSAQHPQVEVTTRDPVLSHMLALPHKPCIAGHSLLNIEPDGTVTPCRYMYEELGNVRKTPLKRIIESETFRQYGDVAKLKGICMDCELRFRCVGCRALARHYGDVHGEDPLCGVAVRGGPP
jgi:radical SAM protein with 4Fe4S-binding SPASM domain